MGVETSTAVADAATPTSISAAIALAYHARTKHDLKRYAAGPRRSIGTCNPIRSANCRLPANVAAADERTSRHDLLPDLRAVRRCGPAHDRVDRRAAGAFDGACGVEGVWAGPLGVALQSVERQPASYRSLHHLRQRARSRRRALSLCQSGSCAGAALPARRTIVRTGTAMDRLRLGALARSVEYGERAFRYCQLDIAMPWAPFAMPPGRSDGAPSSSRIWKALRFPHRWAWTGRAIFPGGSGGCGSPH